jgi:hypothetical protein
MDERADGSWTHIHSATVAGDGHLSFGQASQSGFWRAPLAGCFPETAFPAATLPVCLALGEGYRLEVVMPGDRYR